MADQPRDSDVSDDLGMDPDRLAPPPMPRWVKVSAVVLVVLVLLIVLVLVAGIGGQHGPGRHTSSGPGVVEESHILGES